MPSFEDLKVAAAAGKLTASVTLAGEPVEFLFRKPKAREWMEFEAVQLAYGTATKSGSLNGAIAREMIEQAEELCVRVVTSHTPQQLQDLNEEHLGLFLPLAMEIAEVVETLRAGAPKGSPKPGAQSSG